MEHASAFTPHKVKMATVGCPRNCAEATVKDIGLVGQENGWQVVVGGAAGKSVRKADLLITVETTEQALEASELFFQSTARATISNAQASGGSGSRRYARIPSMRQMP
jgi:NAD(P)H-nitrite reductase large subunit